MRAVTFVRAYDRGSAHKQGQLLAAPPRRPAPTCTHRSISSYSAGEGGAPCCRGAKHSSLRGAGTTKSCGSATRKSA